MLTRAIVLFSGLLRAFRTPLAVLTTASIGGFFLGLLVAQLNQPRPERAKPGQQHQFARPSEQITNREDGEKAVVAKRCAYLKSGNFTEANYTEFVQKRAFNLQIDLATFIDEQCNRAQDFFVRVNGTYLDYFVRDLEARDDFRPTVQPSVPLQ